MHAPPGKYGSKKAGKNMSKKENTLTGPHERDDEHKDHSEDEEIKEINKAIDVASDLASWTKTPAGRDTIERLQNEARKSMNELFSLIHDNPDLGKLISAVARFEAAVQMARRFTGSEDDLKDLLDTLAKKRGEK